MSILKGFSRLSFLQSSILAQTVAGSSEPISQCRIILRGDSFPSLMRHAFQTVTDRHDILRTCFLWENLPAPIQVVQNATPVSWEERDWRGINEELQKKQIEDLMQEERRRGFDLTRPPLMRLALVRTSNVRSELIWTWHKIVLDDFSITELFSEVIADCQYQIVGDKAGVALRQPYSDYIEWLIKQDVGNAEDFWKNRLHGFFSTTHSPWTLGEDSRPVPSFHLTMQESSAIAAAAGHCGVSIKTFAQAAWALLLASYSRSGDVVFGQRVCGRPVILRASQTMLGPLSNIVPVRIKIQPEMRCCDWLRQIDEEGSESEEFQFVPVSQIQRWSELHPDMSLFETVLAFEDQPSQDWGEIRAGKICLQWKTQAFFDDIRYPLTIVVNTTHPLSYHYARTADDTQSPPGAQFRWIMVEMVNALTGPVAALWDALQHGSGKPAALSAAYSMHANRQPFTTAN